MTSKRPITLCRTRLAFSVLLRSGNCVTWQQAIDQHSKPKLAAPIYHVLPALPLSTSDDARSRKSWVAVDDNDATRVPDSLNWPPVHRPANATRTPIARLVRRGPSDSPSADGIDRN